MLPSLPDVQTLDLARAGELELEVRSKDPGSGCTLGALSADAARQGPELQSNFAEAVEQVIGILADHFGKAAPGEPRAQARARAVQQFSELIGALVLARAVSGADPQLSEEILSTNPGDAAVSLTSSAATRPRLRAARLIGWPRGERGGGRHSRIP